MKYYLAPLEGVTGYVYRNALHDTFGDTIDKYFLPFISPHTNCSFDAKELKDLLPENNKNMYAVPQSLTNSAPDFTKLCKDLKEYGYNEVNINIGCPSGTVTSKCRGAGLLGDLERLDNLLYDIFANQQCKISVKTRIGIDRPEEFYEILDIYNKYPLHELIIHPRVLHEYYKGIPHRDIFLYALANSKNPIVYNSDIWDLNDYQKLKDDTSNLHNNNCDLMIGRGIIANPSLFNMISKYEACELNISSYNNIDYSKIKKFHDRLLNNYREVLSGDTNVLFKMKEIWSYMIRLFPDSEKTAKKIKKTTRLSEYNIIINSLF